MASNKFWSLVDNLQIGLDWAGTAPKVGAIPDIVNTAISLVRGDWDAAGSRALQIIPGAQLTKLGKLRKGTKTTDKAPITKSKVVEGEVIPPKTKTSTVTSRQQQDPTINRRIDGPMDVAKTNKLSQPTKFEVGGVRPQAGGRNIRDVEGRTLPNQKPPTTKPPKKSKQIVNRVISGLLTGTDEEEMEMESPAEALGTGSGSGTDKLGALDKSGNLVEDDRVTFAKNTEQGASGKVKELPLNEQRARLLDEINALRPKAAEAAKSEVRRNIDTRRVLGERIRDRLLQEGPDYWRKPENQKEKNEIIAAGRKLGNFSFGAEDFSKIVNKYMDEAVYNKESKEALMFPQGKIAADNISMANRLGNTPNPIDLKTYQEILRPKQTRKKVDAEGNLLDPVNIPKIDTQAVADLEQRERALKGLDRMIADEEKTKRADELIKGIEDKVKRNKKKEEGFKAQGFDETGIVENMGGYGIPSPSDSSKTDFQNQEDQRLLAETQKKIAEEEEKKRKALEAMKKNENVSALLNQ
tara:strand:- start:2914 stop:4488 length:1575 start_codon:yes stop_codon:yes gene_type:complete